mmetsp:Transcript_29612/g.79999  ORF Transcript_29612/g.79999 Transcript_29612/m.79999 type:complete len:176 (-) Transcript_29612:455-982(-)
MLAWPPRLCLLATTTRAASGGVVSTGEAASVESPWQLLSLPPHGLVHQGSRVRLTGLLLAPLAAPPEHEAAVGEVLDTIAAGARSRAGDGDPETTLCTEAVSCCTTPHPLAWTSGTRLANFGERSLPVLVVTMLPVPAQISFAGAHRALQGPTPGATRCDGCDGRAKCRVGEPPA